MAIGASEQGFDSHTAYIAFGSNMGRREEYIKKALLMMEETVGSLAKVSSIIETEAYGYTEQEDFLNGVAEVQTRLTPEELLERLQAIEKKLDRVRVIHWGPRTIDLDIIFYDDCIIHQEQLVIPHGDFRRRDFVLTPMVEIAPGWKDPVTGKTMAKLQEELQGFTG